MPNRNYVIGGFVIFAVIAGAIFWSRGKSPTLDASVSEHGAKNLTREMAAEKIKIYLGKAENKNDNFFTDLFGDVASIEITGLTEPTESGGGKIIFANFTAKYKTTPTGKVTDKEQKAKAMFTLYDDGWRIKPPLLSPLQ